MNTSMDFKNINHSTNNSVIMGNGLGTNPHTPSQMKKGLEAGTSEYKEYMSLK